MLASRVAYVESAAARAAFQRAGSSAGRLTAHSEITGGYNVQYGYDTLNRLHTVTDLNDNSVTTYHYDAASRLSSYDYPNTVTTTMAYDTLNRVQNVTMATSGESPTTLASYSYMTATVACAC